MTQERRRYRVIVAKEDFADAEAEIRKAGGTVIEKRPREGVYVFRASDMQLRNICREPMLRECKAET